MKPEIVKWAKGAGYGGQPRNPKGKAGGGQFAKGKKAGGTMREKTRTWKLKMAGVKKERRADDAITRAIRGAGA